MHQSPSQPTTAFCIKWLLGNALPWSLWPLIGALSGGLLWVIYDSHVLPWQLEQYLQEDLRLLFALLLTHLVLGAILGWIQRSLLVQLHPLLSSRWLVATVLGSELYASIQALGVLVGSYGLLGTAAYLIDPLAVSVLAIPQWLLLRKVQPRAGLWLAGSAGPLLLLDLLRWASSGTAGGNSFIAVEATYISTGLAYALGTLIALALMARSRKGQVQPRG